MVCPREVKSFFARDDVRDDDLHLVTVDSLPEARLMIPKQIGQHAVSFHIHNGRIFMAGDPRPEQSLMVQGESVVALITVLTDLGITSRQLAALKAAGVLLGILGTILSYPFWKMVFRKKLIRSRKPKSKRVPKQSRSRSKAHS